MQHFSLAIHSSLRRQSAYELVIISNMLVTFQEKKTVNFAQPVSFCTSKRLPSTLIVTKATF